MAGDGRTGQPGRLDHHHGSQPLHRRGDAYNILARQFPTNLTAMLFGYKTKATFEVEDEKAIAQPPKVDFAPRSAVPAAPAQSSPAPATAPTPGK